MRRTCGTAVVAMGVWVMVTWVERGEAGFRYDATGVRDPMVRQLIVSATNAAGAKVTSVGSGVRKGDIERAVRAARIEGVAISLRERCVVINDRLVREGEVIGPGQAIRVVRIEQSKIVFGLDNDTYEYYLTPSKEMTKP